MKHKKGFWAPKATNTLYNHVNTKKDFGPLRLQIHYINMKHKNGFWASKATNILFKHTNTKKDLGLLWLLKIQFLEWNFDVVNLPVINTNTIHRVAFRGRRCKNY